MTTKGLLEHFLGTTLTKEEMCKHSPVKRWVMPDDYSKEMPSEEGAYWMICAEGDYERSPTEIRFENGELIADDPYLGVQPLEHFHNALTDICWKRAMKA